MEKGTVVNRLIAWSRWKMRSGEALGFPKSSAFMNLAVDRGRSVSTYEDVDSWCKETDEAVMSIDDDELRKVIAMEYLSVYKIVAIKAHRMRMDKRTYHRRLQAAYKIVGENIEKSLHSCHTSGINHVKLQNVATN